MIQWTPLRKGKMLCGFMLSRSYRPLKWTEKKTKKIGVIIREGVVLLLPTYETSVGQEVGEPPEGGQYYPQLL